MAVPLSLIIWFTFNDSPSSKNYPLSSGSHISFGALRTFYYCTWSILFQEELLVFACFSVDLSSSLFLKIIKFFKKLFIYLTFCLPWVFTASFLVAVSGGYLRVGFSLQWLLLWSMGPRCSDFSSCGKGASLPRSMRNLPGPGIELVSLHWQVDS